MVLKFAERETYRLTGGRPTIVFGNGDNGDWPPPLDDFDPASYFGQYNLLLLPEAVNMTLSEADVDAWSESGVIDANENFIDAGFVQATWSADDGDGNPTVMLGHVDVILEKQGDPYSKYFSPDEFFIVAVVSNDDTETDLLSVFEIDLQTVRLVRVNEGGQQRFQLRINDQETPVSVTSDPVVLGDKYAVGMRYLNGELGISINQLGWNTQAGPAPIEPTGGTRPWSVGGGTDFNTNQSTIWVIAGHDQYPGDQHYSDLVSALDNYYNISTPSD